MRNTSKVTTLESKFPLLAVEQGCIVSKDADITVAFRVELPELFTVTSAEYEAMHAAWHKAVKVLPDFTIVHKQDWFVKERYAGRLSDGELSFLARASERHFNERPFLDHACYLFLTKTTRQRMARQSNFSSLCRGTILPKDVGNREEVAKFMEAVDQFERIINDDDRIRLTRMTEEELVGTKEKSGLLDRYFSLSDTGHASLEESASAPISFGWATIGSACTRSATPTPSPPWSPPTAATSASRPTAVTADSPSPRPSDSCSRVITFSTNTSLLRTARRT